MWKARVTVVAYGDKLECLAFVESFNDKTREKVWDKATKWVGEIARKHTICSLSVDVTNLTN